MPQLDIGTYASQLFWLFTCFGLLYIFMSRVSVPLIGSVLEKRQLHIEGTLKRGVELEGKAENLRVEFEQVLTESRQHAHQMLVSSVHDIGITTAQQKEESSEAMMARIQSAQNEISRQKDASLKELKDAAGMIASDILQKLINIEPDAAQIKTAVSQTMQSKGA
jgi:F-type H+-transporting ATPase subunit b